LTILQATKAHKPPPRTLLPTGEHNAVFSSRHISQWRRSLTISEVAVDQHELMIPQRIMRLAIHCLH